jgi:Protein of unknown function (DUF4231)
MNINKKSLGISTFDGSLPEKAKLIESKIEDALDYLNNKLTYNKKRASFVKILSIILSGLLTIFLGLQNTGFDTYLKNAAFAMGTIVTLLNALEPFFNFRAVWVENEVALSSLFRLRDDFQFFMAGADIENLDYAQLSVFLDRYKTIWNEFNKNVVRYRKSDSQL